MFVEIHLISLTAQAAMTELGVTLELETIHRMVVEETIHSQVSDLLIEIHMGTSCDWYYAVEDMLRKSSEVVDGQIVPSDMVTVVDKMVGTVEV